MAGGDPLKQQIEYYKSRQQMLLADRAAGKFVPENAIGDLVNGVLRIEREIEQRDRALAQKAYEESLSPADRAVLDQERDRKHKRELQALAVQQEEEARRNAMKAAEAEAFTARHAAELESAGMALVAHNAIVWAAPALILVGLYVLGNGGEKTAFFGAFVPWLAVIWGSLHRRIAPTTQAALTGVALLAIAGYAVASPIWLLAALVAGGLFDSALFTFAVWVVGVVVFFHGGSAMVKRHLFGGRSSPEL